MEETIEFRELIKIILNGKWVIALVTSICILLTGVLSWFILPEKYNSKSVVQVVSDTQDTGIITNYVANEFTPEVFEKRIQNEPLIKKVFEEENIQYEYSLNDLEVETEGNLVSLTYTSNSSKESYEVLNKIISISINEMNLSVQKTLKNLEKTYSEDAESLSNEIESIIDEYNSIVRNNNLPEVLVLQTILNSNIELNITNDQINTLAKVSGDLQNQLLQLQAQIETKSGEYRKVLENYQSVKTSLDSFNPEPFVRVINEPTLVSWPTAPNKVLNLAIGLILGITIGLGIILFRYYWITTSKIK